MNFLIKTAYCILVAIAIILGFQLRIESSQLRIPHADESEQATTVQKLLDGNGYQYNPNGPHGPTLYYYTFAKKFFDKIQYPSIQDLRKSLIPFSLIIMATYLLSASLLGRFAVWGACACFAMSAISIIYSVYYVHEIIFALTILLTSIFAWKFYKNPSNKSAVLLGFFAGLAQATKETSILMFAGIFVALLLDYVLFEKENRKEIFYEILKNLYKLFGVFFAVCILFYSSFGENPNGVLNAFDCYISHFIGKAQSSEHSAPFYYYLQLFALQKSEGVRFGELIFSILFLMGFLTSITKKDSRAKFALFLSVSSLISILILSLIPYKTPWLLLPIITQMCLVCGYGIQNLAINKNILIKIVSLLLCAFALYFQYKSNMLSCVRFHSDPRNPFIYSHTVPDFKNLVSRIEQSVAKSKYNKDIPIAIVTQSSPWPLPYYTRNMQNVGYYSSIPQNLNVFEIVIADYSTETELSKYLPETEYQTEYFGLRKNLPLKIFIKKELFNKIISDE